MGVVVVIDDVADVGHMVGVVQVGLALVGFLVLGIFVNVIIVIAAQQVVDLFIIMRF